MLVVHSGVPAKTLKELIVYAKQNPGKLIVGSAGHNSAGHLTGEMKAAAGIDVKHVPFKDSAR